MVQLFYYYFYHSIKMSVPPLYDSFEESSEPKCIFCKQNTNDTVLYGNKYDFGDMTVHNFCLVSFSLQFILKLFIFFKFLNDFFSFIFPAICIWSSTKNGAEQGNTWILGGGHQKRNKTSIKIGILVFFSYSSYSSIQ